MGITMQTENQTPKDKPEPNIAPCYICGAPLEYHLLDRYTSAGEPTQVPVWHEEGVTSWTDREGIFRAACPDPDCQAHAKVVTAEILKAGRLALLNTPDFQASSLYIPPQYHGAVFEDARPPAAKAIKDWFDAPRPGILLLSGITGTGKTRQLYAIRRAAYLHNNTSRLLRITDAILELQALARESMRDLQSHIHNLANFPGYLLFDDLGTEKLTDYALATFGLLISSREEWQRPTAFSSNLALPAIEATWGSRIASRLAGGTILTFTGKDHRKRR